MFLNLNNDSENSDKYPDLVVSLNGKPVESVKIFKYLGNKIK